MFPFYILSDYCNKYFQFSGIQELQACLAQRISNKCMTKCSAKEFQVPLFTVDYSSVLVAGVGMNYRSKVWCRLIFFKCL